MTKHRTYSELCQNVLTTSYIVLQNDTQKGCFAISLLIHLAIESMNGIVG